MSAYEVALLVATALFVCILLWDNHKIRGRLERSEADIVWLKATTHNTVKVHQKVMDGHSRDIKRLDGKFDELPNFARLDAGMNRLLKADIHRRAAEGIWDHRANKFSTGGSLDVVEEGEAGGAPAQ